MADFPTSVPSFTDVVPTDTLAANNHSERHNKVHRELAAVAAKVGANSSVDTSSHDYKIAALRTDVTAAQGDISTLESSVSSLETDKADTSAVTAAIDAAVAATKLALYPVGSIYTNASNSTNPGTLLGFGTWAAFGKSRVLIGHGQDTQAISFAAADVDTGTDIITVPSNKSLYTGVAVVLTTSNTVPGGLTASTTYYVIRISATTIKLATTLANAIISSGINLTSQGTGTHTLTATFTSHTAGDVGGEETHALTTVEIPAHSHALDQGTGATGSGNYSLPSPNNVYPNNYQSRDTGGSTAHNNMQPYIVVYMWQRTA